MPTAPATKNVEYIGWADQRELTAEDAKKLGFEKEFRKSTFIKGEARPVDAEFADILVKKDPKSFKITED